MKFCQRAPSRRCRKGRRLSALPSAPSLLCVGTPKPEEGASEEIDDQLEAAGWLVQDRKAINLAAAPGIAVREFPLKSGPVDYGLYVDGAVTGAIEAKKRAGPSRGSRFRPSATARACPTTSRLTVGRFRSSTSPRASRRSSRTCWIPTPVPGRCSPSTVPDDARLARRRGPRPTTTSSNAIRQVWTSSGSATRVWRLGEPPVP